MLFLSTFVMIGQNRQAAFQQAKSDRDYRDLSELLVENTDLTRDRPAHRGPPPSLLGWGGVVAFDEVTTRH
jgi:hypothetical protein